MTRAVASARFDAASKLKVFFHAERALTIAGAAWTTRVHRIDNKATLAKLSWHRALAGHAIRERVFEMRYPERDLTAGREELHRFDELIDSRGPRSFLAALVPALQELRSAYAAYLDASDDVADGPTFRILTHAIEELDWAIDNLAGAIETEPDETQLAHEGFSIPDSPARDDRYHLCAFYWPDIVDPDYPYGEGLRLRLRSAISHLNEVWAVETAGAILHGFAESLGWDFIVDAARWLYDESRHMTMGARRLEGWGLDRSEIPLGSYIYEACSGRSPLIRLGMLAHFETKNIGKKKDRVGELARLGDEGAHRDMDFDWADEAIHAGYGRKWMKAALAAEGRAPDEWAGVVKECERLVAGLVAGATDREKSEIEAVAESLVERLERGVRAS